MSKTLDIIGHTGVPMFARLVEAGERYGKDGCLVYDGDGAFPVNGPLVEFYDERYDFEKWLGRPGQFISRYYLSTLGESEPHLTRGLCLDGGVDDWAISGTVLQAVVEWAVRETSGDTIPTGGDTIPTGGPAEDLALKVGRIFDDMKADALKRIPSCISTIAEHKERLQDEPFATPKKYVVAYCEWAEGQYAPYHITRPFNTNETLKEIMEAGL